MPPSPVSSPSSSSGATFQVPRRPAWLVVLDGVRKPHVAMLLWGVAFGLLGALLLLAVTPEHWNVVMKERAAGLRDSMIVLKQGGPLLLGRHGVAGSLYAVGIGDDEGAYVYLPVLSRLFGVTDPLSTLRYIYVLLYCIAIAVYPLVFYKLTRSLLAGLAAPLMLLVCFLSMGFFDIYWLQAWGVLMLLPLIFLLARDWPRLGLVALVGISLVASMLSSVRNESGLGIVIAAAAVLFLRRWAWWRVLPAVALLAVAYISIPTFVLSAIREHRNHQIGDPALSREPTSHPLWHSAYIGLGYLPNNYDIFYKDEVAIARVQREAPGTPYLSGRYASVLKGAYLKVVRDHPGEVIKQYAAKAVVTTADTILYLLIVLLTMPAMLLLGPERRIRRRWVLLTLPVAGIGFLPSMVAVPLQIYEEGLYAALGVIGILGLCWTLERVEVGAREWGGLRQAFAALRAAWSSPENRHGPLRQSARITCIALAASIGLLIGGHFIRQSAERWQGSSSGVLIDDVRSAGL